MDEALQTHIEKPGSLSWSEFLYLSELRFLDDLSINRKPSISAIPQNAVTTLGEKIEQACLFLPELELHSWVISSMSLIV